MAHSEAEPVVHAEGEPPARLPAGRITPLPARDAGPVVAEVLAPLIARGLIQRRPRVVRALALLDADRRAIRRLRALAAEHGPGPLLLRLPGRNLAVVLTSGDAREVLARTPEPFTPATREKRAALSRFEPHGVLISPPAARPARRAFNERALDTGSPVHRHGAALAARVETEADALMKRALDRGELGWPDFHDTFDRVVRGVVLGEAAAGDAQFSEQLSRLREDANWGYLLPKRRELRDRFLRRLRDYLADPDPAALSGHIAALGSEDALQQAVDQVPQWLFAFDAAAIASFAALGLLATHTREGRTARAEAAGAAHDHGPPQLPFLRACVLESLRLWPTTPAILRDVTSDVAWQAGRLPAGSGVLIFAPLFHRDRRLQPDADTFAPGRWLDPGAGGVLADPDPTAAIVPFSDGPGRCPGRELVLLVTSQLIACVLTGARLELGGRLSRRLQPGRPLPATLDHFRLGFQVRANDR